MAQLASPLPPSPSRRTSRSLLQTVICGKTDLKTPYTFYNARIKVILGICASFYLRRGSRDDLNYKIIMVLAFSQTAYPTCRLQQEWFRSPGNPSLCRLGKYIRDYFSDPPVSSQYCPQSYNVSWKMYSFGISRIRIEPFSFGRERGSRHLPRLLQLNYKLAYFPILLCCLQIYYIFTQNYMYLDMIWKQ